MKTSNTKISDGQRLEMIDLGFIAWGQLDRHQPLFLWPDDPLQLRPDDCLQGHGSMWHILPPVRPGRPADVPFVSNREGNR